MTHTPDASLPYRFAWRYNGQVIASTPGSRVRIRAGGGLTIDPVLPFDAGVYEITTIVSNALGCESAAFNIYTECEYSKL